MTRSCRGWPIAYSAYATPNGSVRLTMSGPTAWAPRRSRHHVLPQHDGVAAEAAVRLVRAQPREWRGRLHAHDRAAPTRASGPRGSAARDWFRAVVTIVACSPTATTSGWKLRVTVSRGRSTVTEIIAASGSTVRKTPTNSTSVRPKIADATRATTPTAPSVQPRAVGRGRFSGDEARPRPGMLAPCRRPTRRAWRRPGTGVAATIRRTMSAITGALS